MLVQGVEGAFGLGLAPWSRLKVYRLKADPCGTNGRIAWKDAAIPIFWNVPVFRIAPALEKTLNEQP